MFPFNPESKVRLWLGQTRPRRKLYELSVRLAMMKIRDYAYPTIAPPAVVPLHVTPWLDP